jgi:hypothetical protein
MIIIGNTIKIRNRIRTGIGIRIRIRMSGLYSSRSDMTENIGEGLPVPGKQIFRCNKFPKYIFYTLIPTIVCKISTRVHDILLLLTKILTVVNTYIYIMLTEEKFLILF